jgi:hypothetical protein
MKQRIGRRGLIALNAAATIYFTRIPEGAPTIDEDEADESEGYA